MFIKSNGSFTIRLNKNASFDIPNLYIGPVPKEVEEHYYFKALLASGKISTVSSEVPKDSELYKKDEEAKAKQDQANKVAMEKKELDELTKVATEEAEKKAVEQGLDEVTRKNFVKKEVEEAVKKHQETKKSSK